MGNYPYRECSCGNQIHVGGRSLCHDCLNYGNVEPPALKSSDMLLRDYFAANIVQGLVNSRYIVTTPKDNAKRAYEIADAMIEERNK